MSSPVNPYRPAGTVNVYRPEPVAGGRPGALAGGRSVAAEPVRDDRFGWLLYLYGGRQLVGGALFAAFGVAMATSGANGRLIGILASLYGLYGVLIGLATLARLRAAWLLLVLTQVLGLGLTLASLWLDTVGAAMNRFNSASGLPSLGGSYFGAAISVLVLIFLLDRKGWFYR